MEYVKLIDKCTIVRQQSHELDALLNRLGQYTSIVLHGLFWGKWQTPILQRVPSHVRVAWVFWGGDIYSRREVESQFLAPITGFLYRWHERKNNVTPNTSWEIPFDLFNRIDFCLTSIVEEYEFAKQYTAAPFIHRWYTYYSLEETIGSLMDKCCEGNNIWIGNSAAEWNNHFDALWKLRRGGLLSKLKSEKVIIPLSYGSPWIRNSVMKLGKLLLGKHMQALTEFMPREEYNKLMLSCSSMIVNYYEPAANGNIITALWLGMRVYISERNLAYDCYKRLGLSVFSLESDLNTYGTTKLSDEERAENRKVLTLWYGKQHVIEAVTKIAKELNTPKK